MEQIKLCNINIGILGHVDSGKTSLSKAISTLSSTAAFDKNPQSQERGITLDLGFSAFILDSPNELKEKGIDKLNCTLVDCPGHASLIRTIIGGAQIIDMFILVIDIIKGMQTQTAEGLIIGELTTDNIIVVLNKVDSIPIEKREEQIQKNITKWRGLMKKTKFGENVPIIPVSANPKEGTSIGLDVFMETLKKCIKLPVRNSNGPFKFAIDHCFAIKGKGTVMTGTVLSGKISVNEKLEILGPNVERKVKSIQMFKKGVNEAIQGDRVGILVTDFSSESLERGIAAKPGFLKNYDAVLISVHKIKYYKNPIETGSKFHISIGHTTGMGTAQFFSVPENDKYEPSNVIPNPQNVLENDVLPDLSETQFQYEERLYEDDKERKASTQFALLKLEKHMPCNEGFMLIGSKLDMNIETKNCRIAFYGKILKVFEGSNEDSQIDRFSCLQIYKKKSREASIVRVLDEHTLIAKGLFQQGANLNDFNGFVLERTSDGSKGTISGTFGSMKAGKFKVYFPDGGQKDTQGKLVLNFKRFIYDKEKKMHQK